MSVEPELLELARRRGAALAEVERAALLARADYHAAVRRLHLAGGSLREIAEALSLSHQRIQQIVQGSGGSWWRRAWRNRGTTRDAICTWCGRAPGEVAKMVAGPEIYICDACVRDAADALSLLRRSGGKPKSTRSRCSFCRKSASATRTVLPGPNASVCDECLTLCREFMQLPHESAAR
jgi:hypothetical protein